MKRKHTLTKTLISILFIFGLFCINKSLCTTQNTSIVTIQIPKNSSTEQVATILYNSTVIKNKDYFMLTKKIFYRNKIIQSGNFSIPRQVSFSTLTDILSRNYKNGNMIKITIPEGYTSEQIGETLERNKLVSKSDFLSKVKNFKSNKYWFLNNIPDGDHKIEGFLFPDTYYFDRETVNSDEIINTMLEQFDDEISPYKTYILNNNYNIRNLTTIASLVEKEARKDVDRPKIASVIYNRLNKNMPLQIDASILYVIGHKDKLYNKDLTIKSPYNTYINKGLPPSPICNPGKKSIIAAVHPDKTNYLYYVLNTSTNEHVFSSTYRDHMKNVKKYVK
ncbi:endolytic transglycosylase MltG [Clostridium fermenticellae]|uniref:Endolytic murein transglycosylase n=1 Tax=Clostridium fermenticellae TaxID=2068654 RepID=A0A386H3V3_9CLOT|nr:endolytic transglycosylase MltG [Clostridium fermenticellae]AYD40258.1 endolytic transglycosylase MltG [Clostridium fermenticellae]